MVAVKRVLRYIKKTRDIMLTYLPCEHLQTQLLNLQVDADADFTADKDDQKSYSGYTVMLNENTICWCSRKQWVTATSTVEAKYLALSVAAKQASMVATSTL